MFGIELHGPYRDISGISAVNRELSLALYDIGIPVLLTNIPHWSNIGYKFTQEQETKIKQMEHMVLPDNYIYANYMPPTRISHRDPGAPNICATLFETDRCPFVWQLIEKQVPIDEWWVPTEFGKEAFIKGGLDPNKIQVMPLGVNTKAYNPNVQPAIITGKKKFAFLSTMDYKPCKGPDLLFNAYFQEFTSRDNVTLIFKAYTGRNAEASKQMIKDVIRKYRATNKSDAHVLFIGDYLPDEDMIGLHRAADCYVLPSRGEGWSFGTIQSMACGVPSIMTDATAYRSFMNETNGLLVKCRQIPITDVSWLMREPVMAHHEWWNADLLDLRKQMRWAYEHPKEMKALGEKAYKDVQCLDWHNVAMNVVNRSIKLLDEQQ
jgi:hypothetical protein